MYGFPIVELLASNASANGSSKRSEDVPPRGRRAERYTAKVVNDVPPPCSLGRRMSIAAPRCGRWMVHGIWAWRGGTNARTAMATGTRTIRYMLEPTPQRV